MSKIVQYPEVRDYKNVNKTSYVLPVDPFDWRNGKKGSTLDPGDPEAWNNHPLFMDGGSNRPEVSKEKYFKELNKYNREGFEGRTRTNSAALRREDNRTVIEAAADQLGLTASQRRQAKRWFMGFDLQSAGVRKELIAVCFCSFVVEEDERDQRRGEPQATADGLRSSEQFPSPGKIEEMYSLRSGRVLSKYRSLSATQ